jgi:hypothetical protein
MQEGLGEKTKQSFILNHCKIMKNKHTHLDWVGLNLMPMLQFPFAIPAAKAPIPRSKRFNLPNQAFGRLSLLYFSDTSCYVT